MLWRVVTRAGSRQGQGPSIPLKRGKDLYDPGVVPRSAA